MRSSRYGIEVKRTERGDDGFADDSPYWEAAKRAGTQEGKKSEEDDDDDDDDEVAQKEDPKELKKKEKARKKKADAQAAKRQYEKGKAAMKPPNFKGSQSESSDGGESEGNDQTPPWSKKNYQGNGNRRGVGVAMFSPSDLSRASTIPPTPASASRSFSKNTPKANDTPPSAAKARSLIDDDDEDEDNDFYTANNNDDSDQDDEEPKGSLSPIHEEHVAKEASKGPVGNDVDLESDITDVVDKTSADDTEAEDVNGEPDTAFQQHDDYSDDGGDGEGVGFELAEDPPSPAEEVAEKPAQLDDSSSESSEGARSKKPKKKSQRKKSVEFVTPVKKQKKKRGRKKVTISTATGGQGYAVGNRDYTTVPLSNFERDDGDGDNVRRSSRRKFPPLKYWKNEKVIYEANNEEGDLAEVFGDMPIITGIQQAEPTPYKMRKVTRKVVHSDDEDDGDNSKARKKKKKESAEDLFDSKKLRKVSIFLQIPLFNCLISSNIKISFIEIRH